MSDDWRLRVHLHESGAAHKLTEHLDSSELEHELEKRSENRIVVSRDGDEVFCYADTRDQIEGVERLIRSFASDHGWQLDTELRRWHPSAEEWEDPDKPLPETDAERAAEHRGLIERERREETAEGYAEFEVRVQCHSHRDAVALDHKLRAEGLPTVRRWKYLLIPGSDEDAAKALAERLRSEAPEGTTVSAEGSRRAVFEEAPSNRWAIFGGLGG
jgi:hypothetical protein